MTALTNTAPTTTSKSAIRARLRRATTAGPPRHPLIAAFVFGDEYFCIHLYSIVVSAQSLNKAEKIMATKTVTLRLPEPTYRLFKSVAERENRPLSNFIETAVLQFVRHHEHADEFEMAEIRGNKELNRGLKRGQQDAKRRRGSFV